MLVVFPHLHGRTWAMAHFNYYMKCVLNKFANGQNQKFWCNRRHE